MTTSSEAKFMVADRGGSPFALPLREVVRVATSPRILEAPLIPSGYVGVIDFEEEAVPVWDPFPEAADPMWGATVIVADSPNGRVGFLSDAPPRVTSESAVPFDTEHVAPPGTMWDGLLRMGDTGVPVLVPSRFE